MEDPHGSLVWGMVSEDVDEAWMWMVAHSEECMEWAHGSVKEPCVRLPSRLLVQRREESPRDYSGA